MTVNLVLKHSTAPCRPLDKIFSSLGLTSGFPNLSLLSHLISCDSLSQNLSCGHSELLTISSVHVDFPNSLPFTILQGSNQRFYGFIKSSLGHPTGNNFGLLCLQSLYLNYCTACTHLPTHPPTHPPIHSSIHPSIYPLTHLPILPSSHPSIPLSTHSPTYPSSHPLIHPSLYLPTHPPTHPPIHSSIHPSIYPFTYPTIHPSTHSCTHPSTNPSIHPSIHSLIQPPIYQFTYSSIYSFTHSTINLLVLY